MGDVMVWKATAALGGGLVSALALAFVVGRVAAKRGGQKLFPVLFLALIGVYALGFAARYLLVEVLPESFF